MKSHRLGITLCLSLLLSAAARAVPDDAGDIVTDEDLASLSLADDLVRTALQVGVDGDVAWRNTMLREALDHDPDYPPARWHSGHIRVGKEWLTLEQIQDRFRADERLAGYQQARASLLESPVKDLLLARWCQRHKLSDEAEFHWQNVLRAQPNHSEALRALRSQWYNGQLLTREQIAAQKREENQAARSLSAARKRRWQTKIVSWERLAGQGEPGLLDLMQGDLAAEKTQPILPLVNTLIGQRSQAPADPQACEIVSLNWISILGEDPICTKFLAMHAVGHPWESVRIAAAEQLKERRREEYVPMLLVCARFPVEFACSVFVSAGLTSLQYTLDIQGLESDIQIEHTNSLTHFSSLPAILAAQDREQPFLPQREIAEGAAVWRNAAAQTAWSIKNWADRYNTLSEIVNERITDALCRATGEDAKADPRVWHSWWREYLCDEYELERPPQQGGNQNGGGQQVAGGQSVPGGQQPRPIQKFSSQSSWYQYLPPPPRSGSCFNGSTLVWTVTGPRPIAEIVPGDRVLSQNPTTGELAYQTVLQVTQAAPAPMMRITVDGEEIVSTLGHPFWVVGQRWTMAKHLREGSMLHSVYGPVLVEKLERIPAATAPHEVAYNLEVDDFHTYFVGERKVLVHHLTMLSILDEGSSIVPGL